MRLYVRLYMRLYMKLYMRLYMRLYKRLYMRLYYIYETIHIRFRLRDSRPKLVFLTCLSFHSIPLLYADKCEI